MSNLEKQHLDLDMMVMEDIDPSNPVPERDWESIISIHSANNRKFPINPVICAKIITEIKDGYIPKMVFQQYGINYKSFYNRYNKCKNTINEICTLPEITEENCRQLDSALTDPAFILGNDIDKVRAINFNESTEVLKTLSTRNAETWLAYMKTIHPNEFKEKDSNKNNQVIIKFAPGLIEGL